MIVKKGNKYFVKSEDGKNLGGPYNTKEEAEELAHHLGNGDYNAGVGPKQPITVESNTNYTLRAKGPANTQAYGSIVALRIG